MDRQLQLLYSLAEHKGLLALGANAQKRMHTLEGKNTKC